MEPIIDRELWDKVRRMRTASAKPMCNGKLGIFAGKVYCMNCGYKMRSTKSRDRYYLKCQTRNSFQDACIGAFVSQDKLREIVMKKINFFINKYFDVEKAEEQLILQKRSQTGEKELRKRLEKEERKISELNNALKNLYLDKCSGVISNTDYHLFSKEFHTDMEQSAHIIGNITTRLEEIVCSREEACPQSIVMKYTNITELERGMLDALVERIEVGKRQTGTTSIPVIIYWKV